MSGHDHSTSARADHIRELAQWTSDERTRLILTEMARELDALDGRKEAEAAPDAVAARAVLRPMS